ncbi:flavodoxin family protein [Vallitalea pronyensis]|uniref:Flavodoxin family protein n=1 Tax=Vallitalea pronyensis TaxID=1348613 RepID=A0A8J8MLQ7_9FIRM|nr:NAD(P)H-dependent oxidoreductase [Vallitalea pronyensis]QUI23722.1 flavodoxin family protein [Vallitalea pronyensis]
MNIVVLLGSPRKKDSYHVAQLIEKKMGHEGDIRFDYIQLSDMTIHECKGCGLCFSKGEMYCPLKDDIQGIVKRMIQADGILLASPVYACQITGTLKKAIDRMAYLCHRPAMVGKPFINIVTTAGGGKKPTGQYMKMMGIAFGCHYVGTLPVISTMFFDDDKNSLYNEKYHQKILKKMDRLIKHFQKALHDTTPPRPSYYDIFLFNGLKSKTYMSEADHDYWKKKGWLKANYYYPTQLSIGKKIFGYTINQMIKMVWKRMQQA